MMGEIGIHNYNKISSRELQAVNVCGTETQLASSRSDLNVLRTVEFLQLCSYFLGSVGRAIIDNDKLPLEVTNI